MTLEEAQMAKIDLALGKLDLQPEPQPTSSNVMGTEHTGRNSHAYGLVHAICATPVKDGLLTSHSVPH